MNFIQLNDSTATGVLQNATRVQGTFQGKPTNSMKVQLSGLWDGHGAGIIEAPNSKVRDLVTLGVMTDVNGVLTVAPGSRITVSKFGHGQGNVMWTVALANGVPPNAPQTSQNGVQTHQPPKGPTAQPTPSEHPGITFSRLCETMKACIREAKAAWGDDAKEMDLTSTAHTLFIAADKRNCLSAASVEAKAKFAPKPQAPPPMTAEQKQLIESLCQALGMQVEEARAAVGLKGVTEATATYAQANEFIKWLKNEEAKAMVENDPSPPQYADEEQVPF